MKKKQKYPYRFLLLSLIAILALLTQNGCEKSSPPCEQVCNNGGTVNQDCNCDCPPNTTGLDCGTIVQPTGVRIVRVTVRQFPPSKWWTVPGSPPLPTLWDSGDFPGARPDLYIEMWRGSTLLGSTTPVRNNAHPDVANSLQFGSHPISITPISASYGIVLFDYDQSGSPEFMGIATVRFADHTGAYPFPATVTVTGTHSNAVGQTVLELQVEWF